MSPSRQMSLYKFKKFLCRGQRPVQIDTQLIVNPNNMFITYLTSSSSEVSPHTTQKKKKVFNKEKGGHSHTLHI